MIKVREKNSDKTVNYPNKELVPLVGHVGNEDYYEIEEGDMPSIDFRTHEIETKEEYTNEKGVLYNKWKVSHVKKQLPNDKIISNIQDELGAYLDKAYPNFKRIKHIAEEIYINRKGLAEQEPYKSRLVYIENMYNWITASRQDVVDEITELVTNGTLPSFEFREMPEK